MVYVIAFWGLILVLSYAGYVLITKGFRRKRNRIVFRKFAINDFQNYVSEKEIKHNIKDFFKHTGFSLSVKDYITGRMLILAMVGVFAAFCVLSFGADPLFMILIYLFLVYLSLPRNTFLGVKTPLFLLVGFARTNYLNSVELELFSILTVLKNLIITCKDKPLSAENIITNIIDFSKLTKPHFTEFLSLYRLGKTELAFKYFKNEIGTKLGEDFASILIKLDEIDPAELIDQLELYQSAIRDRCMTEKIKKDKLISDLAFVPVVGIIFLILLNFVAISLFIDAISMYQDLFG